MGNLMGSNRILQMLYDTFMTDDLSKLLHPILHIAVSRQLIYAVLPM
jgi:hypothetical protein